MKEQYVWMICEPEGWGGMALDFTCSPTRADVWEKFLEGSSNDKKYYQKSGYKAVKGIWRAVK